MAISKPSLITPSFKKSLYTFRASEAYAIFVVCVAVFGDVLLQNLVVPVLPYALKERVGLTDKDDIQKWNSVLLGAFGGTFMLGSFLFGIIADHFTSHRTPFVLALILNFVSTLCFALGATLPILLTARLFEGLSAAIISTVGFALMREVVGNERLGRAIGFTSMSLSMGLLSGPVIGGVLYEYCGYFETFLPALVLVGVEVVLRLLLVENQGAKSMKGAKGDLEGGVEEVGERGVPSIGDGYGTMGDGNGAGAGAVTENEVSNPSPPPRTQTQAQTQIEQHPIQEDHHRVSATEESQPLIPPPSTPQNLPTPTNRYSPRNAYTILLTSPRFLISLTGLFILNSTASAFDAVLTPYISSTFSLTPVDAATLFLTLAIPMLFSPLTGALTDRLGSKPIASSGLAIAILSFLALGLVGPGTRSPMVKLAIVCFSVGVALALTPIALRVDATMVVAEMEEETKKSGVGGFGEKGAHARAFGLVNGMAAAGGLVGPLGAGWLRMRIGWLGMAWVMGGLSLGILVGVICFTGGRVGVGLRRKR